VGSLVSYTPLRGGLDYVQSPIAVKEGKASVLLNYELVYGRNGYKRVDGYERFDGRPLASTAKYFRVPVSITTTPVKGDSVVLGAVSALVVEYVPNELVVCYASGSIPSTGNVVVNGTTVGTITGVARNGAIDDAQFYARRELAHDVVRALTKSVTGSGAILGVAILGDKVIAVRNEADGKTAAIYESSSAGWVKKQGGLLPNGAWRFSRHNFLGTSRSMALYCVDGRNNLIQYYNGTATQADPIFGSQATSTTSLTPSLESVTLTLAQSTVRSFKVGDRLIAYSKANAAIYIKGAITAMTTSSPFTVTINVDGIGITTAAADWQIGYEDFRDKPYIVAAHKDHLFLGYQNGQLQHSDLGQPMNYGVDGTAGLFGVGDEISGLISLKGGVLGVICRNKIYTLYGSTTLDWRLDLFSPSSGAMIDTIGETVGDAIMFDDIGITTLTAVNSFGDFQASVISRDIKPLLDASSPSFAIISKSKSQYRLFTGGGSGVTATMLGMGNNGMEIGFSQFDYVHDFTCGTSGEINGEEWLLCGTTDGYVMRLDSGNSFDGQNVLSILKTHYQHYKSFSQKKRFKKITLELDAPEPIVIKTKQLFDGMSSEYESGIYSNIATLNKGGILDASNMNEFLWSQPALNGVEFYISGVGRDMSCLFVTEGKEAAHFFQGFVTHYTSLGVKR
jgi:hypothetical protein